MKKWFTKFSGAVLFNALTSLATFLSGIFILRLLTGYEAGRYTLLFSSGTLVTLLGSVGHIGLTGRIYTRSEQLHNWRSDFRTTSLYCTIQLLVAAVFLTIIYKFVFFEFSFVFLYALLNVLSNLSGVMLNSQGYYTWAGLLFRLQNALFIIPVLLMLVGILPVNLNFALISMLITGFLCDLLGWYLLERYMPSGEKVILSSERIDSIGFSFIVLSHSIFDPGLLVIAGYFLKNVEIAALGGLLTFLRPVLLIWTTMNQSLSVEFVRNKTFSKRKIFQTILLITPLAVILGWLGLPWLLHFAFAGKYDLVQASTLPAAVIAGLLISETIPRSYISGIASTRMLNVYSIWMALLSVLFGVVEVTLIQFYGVFGVMWAGVFMLVVRNILGYILMIKSRNQIVNPL